MFNNMFNWMNNESLHSLVRIAEVEYAKEFRWIQKNLGRRPGVNDVRHLFE